MVESSQPLSQAAPAPPPGRLSLLRFPLNLLFFLSQLNNLAALGSVVAHGICFFSLF